MRALAALALVLALTGCARTPQGYPIPEQHAPITAETPPVVAEFGEFVRADDAGAEKFFVKDVQTNEGAGWRWTLAEPELRFSIKSAKNKLFVLEFAVSGRTLKETGPVRMLVLVNGHELGQEVYPTDGEHIFEKPVPAEFLLPGAENRVIIRVLNPWQSSDPGIRLGILFKAAGFRQQ